MKKQFAGEFKILAVRVVRDQGVAVVQTSCDLDFAESVLPR
jgi:hypothetical protein